MAPKNFKQAEITSLAAQYSIEKIITLRTSGSHVLYRLINRNSSFILKWFTSANSIEPEVYGLLSQYRVPTVPLYEHNRNLLLLEDLQSSTAWRLADQSDLTHEETGRAVAKWYLCLHRAGFEALKDPAWSRRGIHPWVEEITAPALEIAGNRFKLGSTPAWKKAVRNAQALKAKYLSLPQTFNYCDFAAENLALSRDPGRPLEAIVFDYDCFSTGTAGSDWRNVMFSLQGAAREGFRDVYGENPAEEKSLDEPLSVIYGLIVASRRDRIPSWVYPLIDCVVNGQLE